MWKSVSRRIGQRADRNSEVGRRKDGSKCARRDVKGIRVRAWSGEQRTEGIEPGNCLKRRNYEFHGNNEISDPLILNLIFVVDDPST